MSKLKKYGIIISQKYPSLKPFLEFIRKNTLGRKRRFSGWRMTTEHEPPWNDEYEGKIFQKAAKSVKNFQFFHDINAKNVDDLLWRHWVVSTAVRYAIKFAETREYNFVECGVGEGCSAFFALNEITGRLTGKTNYTMHLYDSWEGVKEEFLKESEKLNLLRYKRLKVETTQQNLAEFKDCTIYHQGFIPDSLKNSPKSPDSIVYLHIDLNSSKPTLDSLDFFFSRLVKGGVILFDDYGWESFLDTKKVVDKFLHDKPGILFKYPTGQALYTHR